MSCQLSCSCGKVQGTIETAKFYNRCVCYCKDCQAFAHYLQQSAAALDDRGGTAILQTLPADVHIQSGAAEIQCVSLKPEGLLRWYTACCNTPIGNTPRNFKLPFVGLIQTCVYPQHGSTLNESLGPITMQVNTQSAKGDPKPKATPAWRIMLKFMPMLLRARLNGSYRQTPFFSTDGKPLVAPTVLEQAARDKLFSTL